MLLETKPITAFRFFCMFFKIFIFRVGRNIWDKLFDIYTADSRTLAQISI